MTISVVLVGLDRDYWLIRAVFFVGANFVHVYMNFLFDRVHRHSSFIFSIRWSWVRVFILPIISKT